jgi:hypothetical protein
MYEIMLSFIGPAIDAMSLCFGTMRSIKFDISKCQDLGGRKPDERGVTHRVTPVEILPVDSGDDAKMDSLVFIL